MKTLLLPLLLALPLAAQALETSVDPYIQSNVSFCDARLEVAQLTFNLYDRGEFLAIQQRIARHDEFADEMRKADKVTSKSYKYRQEYLLNAFNECIDERTQKFVKIVKK